MTLDQCTMVCRNHESKDSSEATDLYTAQLGLQFGKQLLGESILVPWTVQRYDSNVTGVWRGQVADFEQGWGG